MLLIKIFYDLNCQDIPEFFEENLPAFSALFEKYLVYSNPLLSSDDEEEEGPLEEIKTGICHILELYVTRYEDVFPQLSSFVPIIVGLLTNTNLDPKYDNVSIIVVLLYSYLQFFFFRWYVRHFLFYLLLSRLNAIHTYSLMLMLLAPCAKQLPFPTLLSEVCIIL